MPGEIGQVPEDMTVTSMATITTRLDDMETAVSNLDKVITARMDTRFDSLVAIMNKIVPQTSQNVNKDDATASDSKENPTGDNTETTTRVDPGSRQS